jgi:hypothetical protein
MMSSSAEGASELRALWPRQPWRAIKKAILHSAAPWVIVECMSQHVLARISGFGWTVVPYAPFQCESVADRPRALIVQHESMGACVSVESGRPEFELAAGTASIHDVADVMRGPAGDHWRIETTVFMIRWPAGFAVWSSAKAPGFDLLGPHDTMIYLQGPVPAERVPPVEQMVAADQTMVEAGSDWVEVQYEHEGIAWRQKHRLVPLENYRMLVTAQGPAEHFAPADEAARQIAESLERFRSEESEAQ